MYQVMFENSTKHMLFAYIVVQRNIINLLFQILLHIDNDILRVTGITPLPFMSRFISSRRAMF